MSTQDMMPIYYKRLFPFELYYKWLSYGNRKILELETEILQINP